MFRSARVIIDRDAFVTRRAGVVFRSDALEFNGPRPMFRGDRVIIEGNVVVSRGAGVIRRGVRFQSREPGVVDPQAPAGPATQRLGLRCWRPDHDRRSGDDCLLGAT